MTRATRGEVNLARVERVGGRGVERGVKLEAPGLVLPQELGQHLGACGHQVRGDQGSLT